MAPIPGPESQLQEVKNSWGSEASTSLENILTEFDDLLGARRISLEEAAPANQEVRNLRTLEMIQPSQTHWASGLVTIKKKNG